MSNRPLHPLLLNYRAYVTMDCKPRMTASYPFQLMWLKGFYQFSAQVEFPFLEQPLLLQIVLKVTGFLERRHNQGLVR